MKVLFVINDPPYGTEKAYNALRLAMALQNQPDDPEILIFLMADSVTCALSGQATPNGFYNIERMLKAVMGKGGKVKACASCLEARGAKSLLMDGVDIGNMDQLARWTIEADRVMVF